MYEALVAKLVADGVPHRLMEHEPAETSAQSALIRGTELRQGAKALVLRSKGKYMLVVISAACELDPKKLRKLLGLKSLSFASPAEVEEKFFLLKGAVPPFGSILDIPTYADESLRINEEIVFNCGLRCISAFISLKDWIASENPTWLDCTVAKKTPAE